RPRPARGGPPAPRHDLDQRLPPLPAAGRMGRIQALRLRPRARPHRPERVPRSQAHLPEHRTRRHRLVLRGLKGVVVQTTHTFDYVVVGGGSAGAAVAARLSEDPTVSVGLLEAGPSDVDQDVVLNLNRWMELLESGFDWDYPIEEQQH